MAEKVHPCQKCGACCSSFRVSFYWTEMLPESFNVPEELTTQISPFRAAMKTVKDLQKADQRTELQNRCVAFSGQVGTQVACGIYDRRPSPCRKFKASYENGQPEPRCDEARASFSLPPLTLQDWSLTAE